MTPVLHTEAPPRVPGCLSGHAPKQYPAGRVCGMPGCTTIRRRTNAGWICDPCANREVKAEVAAIAAKEDGVDHVSDAEVLAKLVTGEYVSGGAIGLALGISRNAVNKHVKNLRTTGWHIEAVPRKGMMLMDVKPEDAPDLIPPAPAPATEGLTPEHAAGAPADEAPASESLPPQARLAPFAGIDYELVVIGEVVRRIESLTGHETRVRVAAYVASRFL